MNYLDKPPSQKYFFLAAFSRKPKSPVYHSIVGGAWTKLTPSPSTSKESYANFGQIASNLHEIGRFLQLENEAATVDLPHWSDVAATANGGADGALFRSLCTSGGICYYLHALAEVLCADKFLEQVYPDHLQGKTKIQALVGKVDPKFATYSGLVVNTVVGCDWVGDELGHPFCIFSHNSFVRLIATWMQHNENIGVRIHAGEGPIRPCTLDGPTSKVRLAFYLHMYIVCESIKLYHSKLTRELASRGSGAKKVNLRIGHGVAFLFGCYEVEPAGGATSSAQRADPFVMCLKNFRDNFLKKHNIVCELNPTSNHMLLPSTFHGGETLHNHRTLPTFLAQGLPVVLGTDDDGIWAIHKCKRHYHHVSVAAEYCQAIEDGEITSRRDLERMLTWGRKSASVWSEEKDAAGTTEVDTETDDMI